MSGWVVAVIANEVKALSSLNDLGFENWSPKIKKTVSRSGRKIVKVESLFHPYTFVKIYDRWRELLSAVGVRGIVRFGGAPAIVRNTEIDRLRQCCDSEGYVRLSKYTHGQKVFIKSGPYAYQCGIYQGVTNGKNRVDTLVQFMGAWVHATITEDDLVAA